MASHLTVTTSNAGISTAKGLSASGATEAESGGGDVFADMLGAAGKRNETAASRSSEAGLDLNLGNLVNLSFGFGGEGSQPDEEPDAVAAVVETVTPFQNAMRSMPELTEIIDGLADLKARLAAGEPLDPEALKRLDAALANLAEALDIDLDALPSLDQLTAMASDILPGDGSIEARLTLALAPLAETLLNGNATNQTSAAGELSGLIKSIGDKLAALLSQLNGDDMSAEQRAQLGLQADADLDGAIEKLANPGVKVETVPALATPTLKLPEAVLATRTEAQPPADAPVETKETTQPALQVARPGDGDRTTDNGANSGSDERKPGENRTPVAATADKQPDVQTAAQPAQTARVDAVAAPRVVQVGYQTSQQQLNLPQLAFELVRQVNDGNTRFQIRLDPPELGKIDVKIDIDTSGKVNARLTVEKAETLDLMQRDQRGLERALQQAGLDGAKTNLEFSLKQNPFAGGQNGQDGNGRPPFFRDDLAAEADEPVPPTVNLYRGSLSASGVNIIA